MALGTTTLITSGGADAGQVNCDRITVVLDSSYPTGGYTGLADKIRARPTATRPSSASSPRAAATRRTGTTPTAS